MNKLNRDIKVSCGEILVDVLLTFPEYKKSLKLFLQKQGLENVETVLGKWLDKRSSRLFKKVISVPTDKKIIKHQPLINDSDIAKDCRTAKLKKLKEFPFPVYTKDYKNRYCLLDGNHRRYLMKKRGFNTMKVWFLDCRSVGKELFKTINVGGINER